MLSVHPPPELAATESSEPSEAEPSPVATDDEVSHQTGCSLEAESAAAALLGLHSAWPSSPEDEGSRDDDSCPTATGTDDTADNLFDAATLPLRFQGSRMDDQPYSPRLWKGMGDYDTPGYPSPKRMRAPKDGAHRPGPSKSLAGPPLPTCQMALTRRRLLAVHPSSFPWTPRPRPPPAPAFRAPRPPGTVAALPPAVGASAPPPSLACPSGVPPADPSTLSAPLFPLASQAPRPPARRASAASSPAAPSSTRRRTRCASTAGSVISSGSARSTGTRPTRGVRPSPRSTASGARRRTCNGAPAYFSWRDDTGDRQAGKGGLRAAGAAARRSPFVVASGETRA